MVSHRVAVSLAVIPAALEYYQHTGTSEVGKAVDRTNLCIYGGVSSVSVGERWVSPWRPQEIPKSRRVNLH
jgi:hypothetical protein